MTFNESNKNKQSEILFLPSILLHA